MSARIRHCVECPKCLTRYLISASPYANGSYLVRSSAQSLDEYILYCSCCTPAAVSRWRSHEMKAFGVSRDAHRRGYGSPGEIVGGRSTSDSSWHLDTRVYLNLPNHEKEGNIR